MEENGTVMLYRSSMVYVTLFGVAWCRMLASLLLGLYPIMVHVLEWARLPLCASPLRAPIPMRGASVVGVVLEGEWPFNVVA